MNRITTEINMNNRTRSCCKNVNSGVIIAGDFLSFDEKSKKRNEKSLKQSRKKHLQIV